MEMAPALTADAPRSFAPSPLVLAITTTAALSVLRMTGSVDSDVGWQLWIAGRLNAGAQLYRDIIEVNPPLWFWLAQPIDLLAAMLGVSAEAILALLIGLLVVLALAATDKLLSDVAVARRRLLLSYSAFLLVVLPWVHLGQREQIALVTTLPYAALISRRRQAKEVTVPLAAAIGLGAALGFALKHYFLLVPFSLEMWLLMQRGRRWQIVRPETIAVALAGLVYACAILLWAGAYLTNVIPLIALAYGGIGAPTWADVFGPSAILGLLLLGFVVSQWRILRDDRTPFAAALLVSAGAFGAAYFIQAKGWPYQAVPLVGCASLSLAAMLAETPSSLKLVRIVSPALLALPLLLGVEEQSHAGEPRVAASNAVADLRRGESVGFLATDNAVAWPATLEHGLRYPSRYMSFWMLGAIRRNELSASPDPRLEKLGREIIAQTVQDFRCTPPERLIIDPPPPRRAGFDILAFFERDPDFTKLMAHYRRRPSAHLEEFDRVSSLSPRATWCGRGA